MLDHRPAVLIFTLASLAVMNRMDSSARDLSPNPDPQPASKSLPAPVQRTSPGSRSVLLLPFVSNKSGFETAITLVNTTLDPLGTTPQAGACKYNFYGAGAPPPVTSASLPAGAQSQLQLSTLAPGFQGYMVIVCQFPGAHGLANLTHMGTGAFLRQLPVLAVQEPRFQSPSESLGQ